MKRLHQNNLFAWSEFNPDRNLDFHSFFWQRSGGNVVFDPLAASQHDIDHIRSLGGIAWIVITNSDHWRATTEFRNIFSAKVAAPFAEREQLPNCENYLAENDLFLPGLQTWVLSGSKTPGELAFLVEEKTLICGDLIRCHQGGTLTILPTPKLQDRTLAVASVQRLAAIPTVEAVLVGDGWPIFRDGHRRLQELVATLAP